MQGKVPTPSGDIEVYCSESKIKITGAAGTGTLSFKSKSKPVVNTGSIKAIGNNQYEIIIESGKSYTIGYKL